MFMTQFLFFSQHEVGDVSSRVELRNKLQCHNFKWFLDNVIPHKFIMDEQSLYYGRLKTLGYDNICVDHLQVILRGNALNSIT